MSTNIKTAAPSYQQLQANSGELRDLYPPFESYEKNFLKVSDLHTIYYEQAGNPEGLPSIVIHGGPGGGMSDFYKQYFNPKLYRIVLYDQRGCGKSTPHAELKENTTWDLVEDIEKIRKHLKIEKFHVVFGGSWGSTLALSYAETYPQMVKHLVLRGIFTLRRHELIWFYQQGADFIFADYFEPYKTFIPEVERGDLMSAYYRRLTGEDEQEKIKAAQQWTLWEMATSKLYVSEENIKRASEDTFALAFARIECHYFVNGGFFKEEGQLIKRARETIGHIPTIIVQGRYDVVCPLISAYELHKEMPNSQLIIVPDSGHSMKEPGILSELVKACDQFSKSE